MFTATVSNNVLTLTIPLTPARPSSTGKNNLFATFSGSLSCSAPDGTPLKATISVYGPPSPSNTPAARIPGTARTPSGAAF